MIRYYFISDRLRLTFGFFSFIVTGSHSTVSSIVSTIMFIIQFNFFFLRFVLGICVTQDSVEVLTDLSSSSSLGPVLPTISSGIDSFILRFCQNIATVNRSFGIRKLGARWSHSTSPKGDTIHILNRTMP